MYNNKYKNKKIQIQYIPNPNITKYKKFYDKSGNKSHKKLCPLNNKRCSGKYLSRKNFNNMIKISPNFVKYFKCRCWSSTLSENRVSLSKIRMAN